MIFFLSSFSSVISSHPTFVIPVFRMSGSNAAFVQDLDDGGKVIRFYGFNPNHFYTVPVLPDALSKSVGEYGLLAFWESDFCVKFGTAGELKPQISNLDENSMPAFAAVEAMTFLSDPARISSAVERGAKQLFGEASKSAFRTRVRQRFELIAALSNAEAVTGIENADLESIANQLQALSDESVWFEVWKSAWSQFPGNELLALLARQKTDMPESSPNISYQIASELASYSFSGEYSNIAYDIFIKHYEKWHNWKHLWQYLYRHRENRENLLTIAMEMMPRDVDNTNIDYSWMMMWRNIWIEEVLPKKWLIDIAERASRSGPYPDYFVETVVSQLVSRDFDQENWPMQYMNKWLLNPRGLSNWASAYLNFSNHFISGRYIDAGLKWLVKYGRGTNIWRKFWLHMEDRMAASTFISIGIDWLLRSRKDLSTWPRVFSDIKKRSTEVPPKLVYAAQLWMDYPRRVRHDDLIAEVADMGTDI